VREARISVVASKRAGVQEGNDVILARAVERIERVARDRPDLILLSELFANHPAGHTRAAALEVAQTAPGPISQELAVLAKRYGTYIAFGLLRRTGEDLHNSLVLLDREGLVADTYDKVTPVASEMTDWGVIPGATPHPWHCDFGRVGGSICFDINYDELGEHYHREQIELLLFSSAFPAGRLLDAWAVRFGFAIAGNTFYDANRILDCTGATVARTSDLLPYATAVLNLNRRVVHMDRNLDKLDRMRTRYAGDIVIEDLRDEATCVITSLKKGLEVEDLIREFEVTTLPDYLDHSRRVRAEHGGWTLPRWY
jgi:hypothetical protein